MNNTVSEITIIGGHTKNGEEEPIRSLEIKGGDIIALVGPTGSGKSMLLSDIEQEVESDTPSGRKVFINGNNGSNEGIIAQLSQTMNFIIDMTVGDFLKMHASSRGIEEDTVVSEVIDLANSLAGEPINALDNITTISGGQSRSLMIADVALISNSPIVLIDEIESGGINKLKALEMLSLKGKIIIIASHDPLIILMANRRVVMKDGGMCRILDTDEKEKELLRDLTSLDNRISALRNTLRSGNAARVCV